MLPKTNIDAATVCCLVNMFPLFPPMISRADVYVHDHSTTRWLSDHSPDGRIYFYSENREQSTWKLPEVHPPPPPSVATSDSEDSVQRLHFASPSSSVEELLDDDDRLASIGEDEDDDRANHHNNDPNNNDVVRYKGWLNFAKLPYDCSALSSKKSVKKNWAKGVSSTNPLEE